MVDWKKNFEAEDIFFITPDVKRGLAFAGVLPNYHIICSDSDPIIPIVRKQGANIFSLEEQDIDISEIRNSAKLLEHPIVLDYIKKNAKFVPKIMYFKPSLKLDILIKQNGFIAIGNSAKLNELFEDKISFYKLAQRDLSQYLMQAQVGVFGELNYNQLVEKLGTVFVIQFGHGWAGRTTFFIKDEREFNDLKEKFAFTTVKADRFVKGFTVLNNCCIYEGKIFVSLPAIQIDKVAQLSDKPTVTCGRQWPVKFIGTRQIETIRSISESVGILMYKNGFRGFFGIDFLVEEATGKIYLSEVNPRLTASSAFFTLLEDNFGNVPLLAYHLADFLGKKLSINKETSSIVGSQIILRKPYDPDNWQNKQFGVFKNQGGKKVFVGENYYPAKLQKNECIFMARKIKEKHADDEFARIETKSESLDKPGRVAKWLRDLI